MLNLERLEDRLTPATTALLGGTLSIVGDNQADVIDVFVSNQTQQIVANVNGVTRSFDPALVQRVFLDGGNGNDILTSQVGTVPDVLLGGNGNDSLQAFGTTTFALGGNGTDVIYAIVGAGAFLDGGNGRDRLIGNATSFFGNDGADRPNVVFGSTTSPIQLLNGVLYLLGTAGDDVASVVEIAGTLSISFNGVGLNFNARDVTTVASVLGGGNDSVNGQFSSIPLVLYGTGGNDTLLGGTGDDLLKGGGGNDLVIGHDGNDDLTGDAGFDTVQGGEGLDILRVDAADLFTPNQDRVLLRAQQR